MGMLIELNSKFRKPIGPQKIGRFSQLLSLSMLHNVFRYELNWLYNLSNLSSYNTYSNEVGYGSPYGGYSASVTPQQTMGYDISADYVDSTTTYEPRSTIIDPDFIGGHSKCDILLVSLSFSNALWMWV